MSSLVLVLSANDVDYMEAAVVDTFAKGEVALTPMLTYGRRNVMGVDGVESALPGPWGDAVLTCNPIVVVYCDKELSDYAHAMISKAENRGCAVVWRSIAETGRMLATVEARERYAQWKG